MHTYRGCARCGSSGRLVVLFPLSSHQAKHCINPGLWPSVMVKIQSLVAWMQDYVQSTKFLHKNPWDEYLCITILNMCDSSVCPYNLSTTTQPCWVAMQTAGLRSVF